MKYEVLLTNCLTYKDKDGGISTRLGYRLKSSDYLQESDKFKGYAEMSYFAKGTDLFSKLRKEHFGVPAIITTVEEPSKNNPLRKVTVLKSINIGNELINLL